MNDRYELAHSGNKSTVSDLSPKSNSHDDSGTPDPQQQQQNSSNNNSSSGAHQHKHSSNGSHSHRGGSPDSHEPNSGGSPTMSTSAPGFPPHFSSLASYYSQLNQAGLGQNGPHGGGLTPGSLAHMAQYGQHPGVQNQMYQMSHQSSPGTAPPSNGGGDFRRALPVLF